ncbi:hypothetical protein [uncultured Thiodictyon sp.]|jgi:hypothetical protein|uniref:hypothetical protein n=1 Tax=uncultured Thiodictyon sp. TaxID=1846217 RepID=UPI00260103F8|nr:hypothetical protein [uncultured Thiodictyon sp.]
MNARHYVAVVILINLLACGAEVALAQPPAATPTDAGPSAHWRFLRHDPDSLARLGGGDMVAGMNKLGEVGFELFIVTTANDQGAAGWLYFRQSPWHRPLPQPSIEYKLIDDQGITDLGPNSFADGLIKLENDGWQLAAITTRNGGAGWHFFFRNKVAMIRDKSAGAAAAAPRSPGAAPAAGNFSTPRAAVQTLIAAATARNGELLSHCFADSAAEEFTSLRSQTASQKDLDDLATLFQGATVTDEQIKDDRHATVSVKLSARSEEIALTKTADGWQVVDF